MTIPPLNGPGHALSNTNGESGHQQSIDFTPNPIMNSRRATKIILA